MKTYTTAGCVVSCLDFWKWKLVYHLKSISFSLSGYSPKKDGEGPSGVTDFNWRPLWAEEERGGRTDRSQGENCNSQSWSLNFFLSFICHKKILYSLFSLLCTNFLYGGHSVHQERRRAERAEQQRVRAEKERDRQTRIAVIQKWNVKLGKYSNGIWYTILI